LDEAPPVGPDGVMLPVAAEKIGKMWEKIDKSKQLIQYKLKVDLGQDVQNLIKKGSEP